MPSDILNKVIIKNYDGFKKEIITLGRKYNIQFDEDIFNDTYIKCYEILKNREITEEGVKYYFWVAFLNNSRKKYRRSKFNPSLCELNESFCSDDENEENEEEIEIVEKIVSKEETTLFDEENYNILSPNSNNNEPNIKSQEKKYNDNFFKLHDIVKSAIIEKFGSEVFNIWSLHFIEYKTYKELEMMGFNNVNFHNLFRKVNFYIKNTLPKNDKEFRKLLKETISFD
jgi:hypothetical protein